MHIDLWLCHIRAWSTAVRDAVHIELQLEYITCEAVAPRIGRFRELHIATWASIQVYLRQI